MSSIPLVATTIQQPTSPLDNALKAASLRDMVQRGQLEQGQAQLQQQQVQQGEQALQDQKALSAAQQEAYANWDGKDYRTLQSQLPRLAVKNGASAKAVGALQNQVLEAQKNYSDIAKNDAETGNKNIETLLKKNDLTVGGLQAIKSLPDDQIAAQLPQAMAQMAQQGLLPPEIVQTAPQVAQKPPAEIRNELDLLGKHFMSQSQQAKAAMDAADLAAKGAQLPGQVAESQIKQTEATNAQSALKTKSEWLFNHPGKNENDYNASVAAQKKGAEEAAAFPYQSRLVAVRQQVENQFWNNKDAIGKTEQNVIKPFSEQMQSVAQLNSALDQAAAGNSAAAQAVIPKLVGISQPVGSRRYNQAEAQQLASQGGIPQRFVGTIQKAINGEQWTPQMISDMRELAKAQQQVAVNSANAQIDNINTLHGTKIGHVDAPQTQAKSQQAAPNGGIPQGATKKVPGPDGKLHYTNDAGTVDLGVAQ